MKLGEEMDDFTRVMHRFRRATANAVPAVGLSRGAFFCLGGICAAEQERPEQGGIYVWELAAHTHVHPPAVSRTLRELESRGLVERSVDRSDRRNIKVRPTAEGMDLWAEAHEQMRCSIRRVQERMGADRMTQLVTLCSQLCDIIEEDQAKVKEEGDRA